MKILDRLKCDPECEYPWWKCIWDNSWPWRLIHMGPFWWLCSDCRYVHRDK